MITHPNLIVRIFYIIGLILSPFFALITMPDFIIKIPYFLLLFTFFLLCIFYILLTKGLGWCIQEFLESRGRQLIAKFLKIRYGILFLLLIWGGIYWQNKQNEKKYYFNELKQLHLMWWFDSRNGGDDITYDEIIMANRRALNKEKQEELNALKNKMHQDGFSLHKIEELDSLAVRNALIGYELVKQKKTSE